VIRCKLRRAAKNAASRPGKSPGRLIVSSRKKAHAPSAGLEKLHFSSQAVAKGASLSGIKEHGDTTQPVSPMETEAPSPRAPSCLILVETGGLMITGAV
jgi:hypothetical protein